MHAKGVGPSPIPIEEFVLEKLISAIRFMLDPKVRAQPCGNGLQFLCFVWNFFFFWVGGLRIVGEGTNYHFST